MPRAFAVRLGLRQIDGLGEAVARAITDNREPPYCSMADTRRRSGLSPAMLERLAAADAFRSLGFDRRQALWEVRGLPATAALPLFAAAGIDSEGEDPAVALPAMPLSEHVVADYQTTRLSLKAHPMHFLRQRYRARGIVAAADVAGIGDNRWLKIAGVVLIRQRPGSAKGVVFMTIEDETGVANAVVWPKTLEAHRKVVMGARLILIHGRIQRHKAITHVVAHRLEDLSGDLAILSQDIDMPAPLARADEVKRPEPGSRGHPRNVRILPKSRDFH